MEKSEIVKIKLPSKHKIIYTYGFGAKEDYAENTAFSILSNNKTRNGKS